MIVLTGTNLGKRQQELNTKVAEAVRNGVDLHHAIVAEEKSDIDRLFKIDLASKHKNVNYILDTLKSGDSLYISRALKCLWIYEDEYSNIMSPDYLHLNILPFISSKMKRKMLTAISLNNKNVIRAQHFFKYCFETKMYGIALKFLISTSDTFKMEFIKDKINLSKLQFDEDNDFLVFFIGNSYDVANAYLEQISEYRTGSVLLKIRHLYSAVGEKYLDLLENYYKVESIGRNIRLGFRVSKAIISNHKSRIMKNPYLFVNILNKQAISKCLKIEDIKSIVAKLLPEVVEDFWNKNFCKLYMFIIDKIPLIERFEYMKQIYSCKYPNESFEMTLNFYEMDYHILLMTEQNKEEWALRQIANINEILGVGNTYIWYKFISFPKAFVEIKNYIRITQDQQERFKMIKILIESAKNQEDLTKLLNYYYERHINESIKQKGLLINSIYEANNVFSFKDNCWMAFNKILHSLGIYDSSRSYQVEPEHMVMAIIYHILHDVQLPAALETYLDSKISMYEIKSQKSKLNKEQLEKLYDSLLQFYVNKVKSFENENYDDDLKQTLRKYLSYSCNLLAIFDKKVEDFPDILMKFIKLDWDDLKYNSIFAEMRAPQDLTQDQLIRLLKQDSSLVLKSLPLIKEYLDKAYRLNFNQLLKKLHIYFSNDVAKEFLNFFMKSVSGKDMRIPAVDALTNVIFQLADDSDKINFMSKYVPENPKIDHYNINRDLLHIQESICRYSYMSRPPLSLDNILPYLKGDYIHYCLPMFNYVISNMPPSVCIQFVEKILDSPLSLRKHGLRMAFQSFEIQDLKKVIADVWKNTKNVSLRNIVYTELYNKILREDPKIQIDLSETIYMFNTDLNENDKEIFDILSIHAKFPIDLRGAYLESAWISVSKLPQKAINWQRQADLINCFEHNIHLIKQDIIKPIVVGHIQVMLIQKEIRPNYVSSEIERLNKAKWDLVSKYTVYFGVEGKLDESNDLVLQILKYCFGMWNEVHADIYTARQFLSTFIELIDSKCNWEDYLKLNKIFESIVTEFQSQFPLEEIYLMVWNLRVQIIRRKIIYDSRCNNHSINIVACNFANDISNLIKEYVEKKLFYNCFMNDVITTIKDNISTLSNNVEGSDDDGMSISVAFHLMSVQLLEIYLLAVNILPTDCPEDFSATYKSVIDNIKKYDSKEVHCLVYEKFINSDFKKRKYV